MRPPTPHKPTVTVLGTGSLGTVVATALATADHATTVWNRTPSGADVAVSQGAALADTVGGAITASESVIVCVPSHDIVRAVLGGARHALAGRTVVNLTSGTPDEARATSAWVEESQAVYLDAAAMTGTAPVGTGDALFLYSGGTVTFERTVDTLSALGRAVLVGEDPGLASLLDTALLGMNLGLLTGFYQAVALTRAAGVHASDFAEIAVDYLPFASGLLRDHADQAVNGQFPPHEGTLAVLAAAAEHLRSTSEALGVATELPSAVAALLSRGASEGYGEDGIARLIDVIGRR